ncbi:MAG: PaaI family thioesterase [Acidimicrobiales bacterium]
MTSINEQGSRAHMLQELGFGVRSVESGLAGEAEVFPALHVPGTGRLRTSVLAMWVDTLSGLMAATSTAPAVPVTVELDVHLYEPAPGSGTVSAAGRLLKRGRSLYVAAVDLTGPDGSPLGVGGASFVTSPDPKVSLPADLSVDAAPAVGRLAVPLAERAGCERRGAGVAVLPRSEDGMNSSRTVNGGLIALAAEEALLSLAPGQTLCSLGLRYLQPVRVGPVVATATVHGGLGVVELRDAGSEDRLAVVATGRTFGPGAEAAPGGEPAP